MRYPLYFIPITIGPICILRHIFAIYCLSIYICNEIYWYKCVMFSIRQYNYCKHTVLILWICNIQYIYIFIIYIFWTSKIKNLVRAQCERKKSIFYRIISISGTRDSEFKKSHFHHPNPSIKIKTWNLLLLISPLCFPLSSILFDDWESSSTTFSLFSSKNMTYCCPNIKPILHYRNDKQMSKSKCR